MDYIPQSVAPADPQKIEQLKKASLRLELGPNARVPMLCKGTSCPFIGYCELHRTGVDLPIEQECPIEMFVMDSWKDGFLEAIEADKNDNSTYIRMLVDDLAIEVVLQSRILASAGLDPHPMMKSTMFNFKGDPVEIKQLYPGLDLLLRVHDRKLRKLRELLATPRAKAEAGRLGYDDPSSKVSQAQQAAAKALAEIGGGGYLKLHDLIAKPT
jgi:hypothetical protein